MCYPYAIKLIKSAKPLCHTQKIKFEMIYEASLKTINWTNEDSSIAFYSSA